MYNQRHRRASVASLGARAVCAVSARARLLSSRYIACGEGRRRRLPVHFVRCCPAECAPFTCATLAAAVAVPVALHRVTRVIDCCAPLKLERSAGGAGALPPSFPLLSFARDGRLTP